MKKYLRLFATLLFVACASVAVGLCLIGCGGESAPTPAGDDSPKLNTITGITFTSATYDYDGTEKQLLISGTLPEGVSVSYTANKGTDSGVYNATAVLSGEGYKTETLNATLTINKLTYDMNAAKWEHLSPYTYDGTEKSVTVSGLPEGVTVKAYTGATATNAGDYTASVQFEYDTVNHNAPTLSPLSWTIEKLTYDMSAAKWEHLSPYTYDGTEKSVTVSGLPEGVTVKAYTGATATNAGEYTASVQFEYDTVNHNAPVLAPLSWKINKISFDMSAAKWEHLSPYTYDGTEKSVTVSGLPEGVTVKAYTGATATNAGEYTASVQFEYDAVNYHTPMLSPLSWIINKADVVATMSNLTVEYDSMPHSLSVVGSIPSEVTVTYYYNDVETDAVSEVGTYEVRCVIDGSGNYNRLELDATLTVQSTEKQLYSVCAGNTVYFQNDLDGDKLYKVTSSGVLKINNDVPNYMIADGNTIYYYASSMFSKVIKSYNGTVASPLLSQSGEYLATDGTNIYYAVNNLLMHTADNGIYKVALSGSSDPVRLTTDKARYITYAGGYIYYANASEHDYLYRISTSANGQKGELLHSEAAAYIITDGTNVYFNSTKKLAGAIGIASAVCKLSVSSKTVIKLTTDSGKYLTKIGSYIYYVNNDKLTSGLFGDGIYKVSALLTSDSSLPGTKVLSAENNGYSSLSGDGSALYYYKLNDKHIYRYDADTQDETDLMANFVPPTEEITLSGYSDVRAYNGEIYYTNPADDSNLYKYNPTTRAKYKVLADSVSSVHFNGDHMYFNTYIATNYTFKRMNLQTGEIEILSKGRCENPRFDGDLIYYTRMGVASNSLRCLNLTDGSDTVLYDKKSPNVVGFEKVGDDFYFIMNPNVGYQYIYKYDAAAGTANELNSIKAKHLTVLGNRIYYYATENRLKSCDLDGNDQKEYNLDGKTFEVEINDMYSSGGKVYFSSVSSKNTGLYVLDVATDTVTKLSDKPANGMTMLDGKLYFLQSAVSYTKTYPTQQSGCDGALYCYDGNTIQKVA